MQTLATANNTRTIQASEAKTHFLRILDEVEQGQTVLVTRHGKTIARISPETGFDRSKFEQARKDMCDLRRKIGKLSLEEILSARDEGRA